MSMKVKVLLVSLLPMIAVYLTGVFVLADFQKFKGNLSDFLGREVELSDAITRIEQSARLIKSSVLGIDLKAEIEELLKSVNKLKNLGIKSSDLARVEKLSSDIKEMVKNPNEEKLKSLSDELDKGAQNLKRFVLDKMKSERGDVKAFAKKVSSNLLIFPAIFLGIGIFAIYWMTSRLLRNLSPLMEASRRLQDSDLTFDFQEYKGRDEISRLLNSFKTATFTLKENMETIKSNTEDVATRMDEITASVEGVSSSMDEITQAMSNIAAEMENVSAGIEETTAEMNEVSSATKAIANDASEVANFGRESAEIAEKSKASMKKLEGSIGNISEISLKIDDVVKGFAEGAREIRSFVETITAIAEQTNLLALNAAIEAARAGEAGKGFAVVADEIRKLAEESKRAAEEVEKVVQEVDEISRQSVHVAKGISEEIEKSLEIVRRTGDDMIEIVERIDKISQMIERISAAVEEQTAAVDEVSTAMNTNSKSIMNVSAATQQVTASVENTNASMQEIAASVKEVRENARNLLGVVESYKA